MLERKPSSSTQFVYLALLILICGCTKQEGPTVTNEKCPEGAYMVGNETERGCKMRDEQGNFINHGPWTENYLNGAIHMRGNYYKGLRDGLWIWWYPNGKKMQQGFFVRGRPNESWVQWDENGNRVKRFEGESTDVPDVINFGNALKNKFGK